MVRPFLVLAIAGLVVGGCGDRAESRHRAEIERTMQNFLIAVANQSPSGYCDELTEGSRRAIARNARAQDVEGGTCAALLADNRDAMLAMGVEGGEAGALVDGMEVEIDGEKAVADVGDEKVPLKREDGRWRIDLLSISE